jgi:hypothetical protein
MAGLAQPEDRFPPATSKDTIVGTNQSSPLAPGPASDNYISKGNRLLDEPELASALQLLVERAQYITGATGTALALPQGDEMVCRASAGSSAPAIGARLQVLSGLTGESISRRQLLRCDNAETDPRVNLETCRALGIASIVVLPLFRHSGEGRGLIELFSDHPYAFEERDLIALERMADLTLTALDLAEQRQSSALAPPRREEKQRRDAEEPAESSAPRAARHPPALPIHHDPAEPPSLKAEAAALSSSSSSSSLQHAPVPEALRRMQKCASCGFPVSEGRTLCLDCDKKNELEMERGEVKKPKSERNTSSALAAPKPEEFVPAFLANAVPVKESWLGNHVNLLAIIVLILGILVAVVVFR